MGTSTQVFPPTQIGFLFVPSLWSRANKMGMWHFWQRTPKYHRMSALGHREIFKRVSLPSESGQSIPRVLSPFRSASEQQRHVRFNSDFCSEPLSCRSQRFPERESLKFKHAQGFFLE